MNNDIEFILLSDINDWLLLNKVLVLSYPSVTCTDIVSNKYIIFIRGREEFHFIYHPDHQSMMDGLLWAVRYNHG